MIFVFTLLFGVISAATTPRRPVDLHQCSQVKFDLNDLDSALYMYKTCTALSCNLSQTEKIPFLTNLRNRMDSACLSLVLGCGVGVDDTDRDRRGTKLVNLRKQKLYNLMNYLTDVNISGVPAPDDTDMNSRVKLGLVHTIEDRVDTLHDKLSRRFDAVKRSASNSKESEFEELNSYPTGSGSYLNNHCTESSELRNRSSIKCGTMETEFTIGNGGVIIIILFVVSAILCFLSLLTCKICCLTNCTINALHMISKPKHICIPQKSKKRKESYCSLYN